MALTDLLEELLVLRSQLVSLLVPLSPQDLTRAITAAPGQQVPAHTLLVSSDRHAKAHFQLLRATAQQSNGLAHDAAEKQDT
jgi:hypothetical protein